MTIAGTGGASCGSWTQDRSYSDGGPRFGDVSWVQGYNSGAAVYTGQDLMSGVDAGAIQSWMDNYCASHPLSMVADGADQLVAKLRARIAVRQ